MRKAFTTLVRNTVVITPTYLRLAKPTAKYILITYLSRCNFISKGFDCNERSTVSQPFSNLSVSSDVGILLQDVNASWTEAGPITLRNLNLSLPKGKLCAIIGSVGSGKVGTYQKRNRETFDVTLVPSIEKTK